MVSTWDVLTEAAYPLLAPLLESVHAVVVQAGRDRVVLPMLSATPLPVQRTYDHPSSSSNTFHAATVQGQTVISQAQVANIVYHYYQAINPTTATSATTAEATSATTAKATSASAAAVSTLAPKGTAKSATTVIAAAATKRAPTTAAAAAAAAAKRAPTTAATTTTKTQTPRLAYAPTTQRLVLRPLHFLRPRLPVPLIPVFPHDV
ncbi:hypothetical protein B0H11DRAFT_1985471 [Mycena galericulata]|nr:hypothetical protein B0H11DRAFT_1985471 [Mycena galericulata]